MSPQSGTTLNRTANGGFDRIHSLPPDYGDFEASWIDGLAQGPPAAGAQPAPEQVRPSRPLAPLDWWQSPWLQLAALLLFGVAFAGYPLTAAARRIRGQRGAPLVRRPARWLAATGLATTVGFLLYLLFMLATAANVIGPVLGGRPILWLLLQLLAVGTVVATVATAVAYGGRHRGRLAARDPGQARDRWLLQRPPPRRSTYPGVDGTTRPATGLGGSWGRWGGAVEPAGRHLDLSGPPRRRQDDNQACLEG